MAKTRKKPKALLARFAALRARQHPRVVLDDIKITNHRTGKHTKRSRKISRAVRATVRGLSPRTMHGDVRFNPSLAELRSAAHRALGRGRAAFKKSLAAAAKRKSRLVELDGVVIAPGPKRMETLRKVMAATGAKHGKVHWNPKRRKAGKRRRNPVLTHREGVAIMKRAAKLKRAGKHVPTKFVSRRPAADGSRRVMTLAAAELRMHGYKVNKRGTGMYKTQKGRRIKLRATEPRTARGGAYDPPREVGMV